MDSVNSLLERRNRYIAEHRPDSVQVSNTNQESSLTIDESNIFEGDNHEKKEVESIEEKSDHSNTNIKVLKTRFGILYVNVQHYRTYDVTLPWI